MGLERNQSACLLVWFLSTVHVVLSGSLDSPNMCSLIIKYDGSKTLLGNFVLQESFSNYCEHISNFLMNAYMSLKCYQFVYLACVRFTCAISSSCNET